MYEVHVSMCICMCMRYGVSESCFVQLVPDVFAIQ